MQQLEAAVQAAAQERDALSAQLAEVTARGEGVDEAAGAGEAALREEVEALKAQLEEAEQNRRASVDDAAAAAEREEAALASAAAKSEQLAQMAAQLAAPTAESAALFTARAAHIHQQTSKRQGAAAARGAAAAARHHIAESGVGGGDGSEGILGRTAQAVVAAQIAAGFQAAAAAAQGAMAARLCEMEERLAHVQKEVGYALLENKAVAVKLAEQRRMMDQYLASQSHNLRRFEAASLDAKEAMEREVQAKEKEVAGLGEESAAREAKLKKRLGESEMQVAKLQVLLKEYEDASTEEGLGSVVAGVARSRKSDLSVESALLPSSTMRVAKAF